MPLRCGDERTVAHANAHRFLNIEATAGLSSLLFADDNPVNITDPASNHVVYIEAEGRVYTYLPQPCPCNRIGTVALGQLGSRSHAGRPHP